MQTTLLTVNEFDIRKEAAKMSKIEISRKINTYLDKIKSGELGEEEEKYIKDRATCFARILLARKG